MEKITNYMRATKKRKVQELDAKVHTISKPLSVVEKPVAAGKSLAPPHSSSNSNSVEKPNTAAELIGHHTDDNGEIYENGIHVPTFIYEGVKYVRKGDKARKVDATTQKVVDYIEEHHIIPADFETSHAYGPYSGMTYDARLLRAYKLKLLQPKKRTTAAAAMCITCATTGHTDRDCPEGF